MRETAFALILAAAACRPPAEGPPTVVAATSMLAAAAREVAGDVRIVTIVPPGGCPGHFDLPPSFAGELCGARVVLCHDYQSSLRERFVALGVPPASIVTVGTSGSLLIPDNYAKLVRRVAQALAERGFRVRGDAPLNAPAVTNRPWAGARVAASRQQEDFCRWLGLKVTCVLPRPEDLAPKGWAEALQEPADLVVANLQEGTQAAEALGRERKLPVAVFSNFPGAPGCGATYEDLFRANLKRLDEAWASR